MPLIDTYSIAVKSKFYYLITKQYDLWTKSNPSIQETWTSSTQIIDFVQENGYAYQ